ncbi:MAG: heme-binding protein [Planctomycetota bacterium]
MQISVLALAALINAPATNPTANSATATTMQPPAKASVMDSGSWILRVAGDPDHELQSREGPEGPLFRAGDVFTETKLPVGYPAPTPPNAFEIKHYASVRRAEFSSDTAGGMTGTRGFMPLFRHISNNDIAMTSPVEMETHDTDSDGRADQWTMTFLYHTTDDGPTGKDGSIVIVDTEPMTYLALGVQGRRSEASWNAIADELEAWIAESSEWRAVGLPRVLGYNGPYVPSQNPWWEVQIPVERASTGSGASATTSDKPIYREIEVEG